MEASRDYENRHAQVVMEELGITYKFAFPQSLGDQWWFCDCENIPDKLPTYLTYIKAKATLDQIKKYEVFFTNKIEAEKAKKEKQDA
jgi:hypothetical protein